MFFFSSFLHKALPVNQSTAPEWWSKKSTVFRGSFHSSHVPLWDPYYGAISEPNLGLRNNSWTIHCCFFCSPLTIVLLFLPLPVEYQNYKKMDLNFTDLMSLVGFTRWLNGNETICQAEDMGLIPGLGRSPGGGHGNPLQYSCLENPHGQRSPVGYSPWAAESWAWLSDWATTMSLVVDKNWKHENVIILFLLLLLLRIYFSAFALH